MVTLEESVAVMTSVCIDKPLGTAFVGVRMLLWTGRVVLCECELEVEGCTALNASRLGSRSAAVPLEASCLRSRVDPDGCLMPVVLSSNNLDPRDFSIRDTAAGFRPRRLAGKGVLLNAPLMQEM